MIAVVQRVKEASVRIEGEEYSRIGRGSLVLLGVEEDDTERDVEALSKKLVDLRMFADAECKMNLSLKDIQGQMLVVSQFTLPADCRKGRRPSFIKAAQPEPGEKLYEEFVVAVRLQGVHTQTGKFAAMMEVGLINDGPVTFILRTHNGKVV
ncbi:MAG: D-aminoacyl-tRNA deacylase [Planctomycetota bacterium]|nr:D-aminoacyl-tRNA deacylase [Planctomycetota bacterium]MDA1138706.1 D-aminoacyl-tRNA deacylase [Planctomycetota bacterium]